MKRLRGRLTLTNLFGTLAVFLTLLMVAPAFASAHKRATVVSLAAPSTVEAGKYFAISGRLWTAGTHSGIAGGHMLFLYQGKADDEATRFAGTRTRRGGSYRLEIEVPESGELTAEFVGSRAFRGAEVTRPISTGSGSSAPTPAPTPTPTPAPAPTSLGNPTTSSQPLSQSRNGIIEGTSDCISNVIQRSAPTVTSPTGSRVYAIDYLFVESSSGQYAPELSGDLYTSGTAGGRPVTAWEDTKTGQAINYGLGTMDAWTINPGHTVAIVQYVWDEGVWYRSAQNQACAF